MSWHLHEECWKDLQAILQLVKDTYYKGYDITLVAKDGTEYHVTNRKGK